MAAKKGDGDNGQWWGRGKDILTILVIPMLLWGVHTEIRMAKVELLLERQAQIEQDVRALEKTVAGLNDTTDFTSAEVDALKTKLDAIKVQLDGVGEAIKDLRP